MQMAFGTPSVQYDSDIDPSASGEIKYVRLRGYE
jgi:hypothetical protein